MNKLSDNNHFKYFAPEPIATFPEGFAGAPLVIKTTAERVAELQAWRESTIVCECCGGSGRVPTPTPVGAA